jgi:hypothetical protein
MKIDSFSNFLLMKKQILPINESKEVIDMGFLITFSLLLNAPHKPDVYVVPYQKGVSYKELIERGGYALKRIR